MLGKKLTAGKAAELVGAEVKSFAQSLLLSCNGFSINTGGKHTEPPDVRQEVNERFPHAGGKLATLSG